MVLVLVQQPLFGRLRRSGRNVTVMVVNRELSVLLEDNHCLAINKPATQESRTGQLPKPFARLPSGFTGAGPHPALPARRDPGAECRPRIHFPFTTGQPRR